MATGARTGEIPKDVRKTKLNMATMFDRVDYHPHPGQLKFHAAGAHSRFRVVCAGRRWGKSRSGPHDMFPRMFLRRESPVLGWVVAPTYDLGEKEFRVFWEILIDKLKIPVDKSKTFYSVRTKSFRITTAWGSSIEVRSAEHPESLVGEGLDFVIMAEAAKLKLSHWEKYIRPTLSDKRGIAVFVSTPEGYNWFYDLFLRGQDVDNPDWWSHRSPTWENTIVFPNGLDEPEIQEVKRTLAPEVFEQEYGANFTSFAGRIYSEFDEGYHVIDKYEFNPMWRNYMAIDFGMRNPTAVLQIQVDPSDNVYVWNEYYERNYTATQNADNLKRVVSWRIDGVYYDPAGLDEANTMLGVWRDSSTYDNVWLKKLMMEPAPNEWQAGVDRVKQWLKLGADNKPSLFVARNCRNTIREFNTYRVVEQTETMAVKQDAKEAPRKKDDHAMDALRYFITGHYGLATHFGYSAP